MLSQEVINTANQLPPSAQKMVEDLVELLSFKHLPKDNKNKSDSIKMANNTQKTVNKPFKRGKEAGFGLFDSDVDITEADIDNAVAKAVSEL